MNAMKLVPIKLKEALKETYLIVQMHLLRLLSRLIFHRKSVGCVTHRDIKKILFIRIDRIGDLVLSTPALRAIKNAYPDAELTVLASKGNHTLLWNNPFVDRVITYNRQKVIDKIRTMRQLRELNPDLAIDPYTGYELETAILAAASGAPIRRGYASYGREIFFNCPVEKKAESRHFVEMTIDVLKPFGMSEETGTPEIFLTHEEKIWGIAWLRKNDVSNRHIVGIHPGAYYETQQWLPERFAEIADLIQEKYRTKAIIFGGPGDVGLIDKISSMMCRSSATFVTDNIRKFAAILSCCNLLICNNSGPLHMAVALRIPTISFMGPTIKERWMPRGEIHTILRINDLPCIGCNTGYCRIQTHDCMRLISPDMVMDRVNAIL